MSDVCGIIADIKREGTGVYEFRKLTLLGFDTGDQEIKTLQGLGLKVGDANEKYEGVEIPNISPFKLMRHLAKEFGFKPCVPVCSDLPGDRKSLIWTMVGGEGLEAIGVIGDIKRESEGEYIIPTCTVFGLDKEEIAALLGKGVSFIKDENPRCDGVEVSGSSPFKVMRILCREFGWKTTGDIVLNPLPGDRKSAMWTLTRKV